MGDGREGPPWFAGWGRWQAIVIVKTRAVIDSSFIVHFVLLGGETASSFALYAVSYLHTCLALAMLSFAAVRVPAEVHFFRPSVSKADSRTCVVVEEYGSSEK